MRYGLATILLFGCAGGGGGGGSSEEADAAPSVDPDAEVAVAECNRTLRRAELEGPFACAGEPEFVTVTIEARGRTFEMFKHEASHPLATDELAFPCAVGDPAAAPPEGMDPIDFQAPEEITEACSRPGVRPWHTVKWGDAEAACEAVGWRLCDDEELRRACQGASDSQYPYGGTFESGRCNVLGVYTGTNGVTSEAPTGDYDECLSAEGATDLNGNLWEWSSKRDERDENARFYQGASFKIAQMWRDASQVTCDAEARAPGVFGQQKFISDSVGFRCCRDAE